MFETFRSFLVEICDFLQGKNFSFLHLSFFKLNAGQRSLILIFGTRF